MCVRFHEATQSTGVDVKKCVHESGRCTAWELSAIQEAPLERLHLQAPNGQRMLNPLSHKLLSDPNPSTQTASAQSRRLPLTLTGVENRALVVGFGFVLSTTHQKLATQQQVRQQFLIHG